MKTICLQLNIFLILAFSTVFLFSCDRPVTETTKVTLHLPQKASLDAKFLCTSCLKLLVINIDGPGMTKIVSFTEDPNQDDPNSQITRAVSIDVPTGPARRIQVMGLYAETATETRNINYAATTIDLTGSPVIVGLTMTDYGAFIGGGLAGRYLTGTDSGPSGKVAVSFSLSASSDISMEVETGDIVNGWFNLFASENFPVTYKLDNGQILFDKVVLNDFVPLTGGPYFSHMGRIKRRQANSVYRNQGGGIWQLERDMEDIVYGFFGSTVLTTGKYVCFEHNVSVPLNFSNMAFSSSGVPLLTYDESSSSADIYGIGGTNSAGTASCTNDVNSPRYELNRINVGKNQLDGNGNDSAKGLSGSFTFLSGMGGNKYNKIGNSFYFYTLPGTFNGLSNSFDGLKMFYLPNAQEGGRDNITCTSAWLTANGFLEATFNTAPLFSGASQDISFALANNYYVTDGFVACPTSGGNLRGYGGFPVGNILTASLDITPAVILANSTQQTLTIHNSGTGGTVFNYGGGVGSNISGAPGGTCEFISVLPANNSCTINVLPNSIAGFFNMTVRYQREGYGPSNDVSLGITSSP